jgi:tRNA G18 (ribose-2'-O)-methylase SpoU
MHTVFLVLENVRSAENVGSIFRTADGFGVQKIYLVGYTPSPIDRFGRKRKDIQKTALGAEESVAYESVETIGELLSRFKQKGISVVSVEQSGTSIMLRDFIPQFPLALILGNEVHGVSGIALEQSDSVVEIPMGGSKESFNVGVAAALVLYHVNTF